jgi:heme/copper-type cytochrome/quinol oxidase subunit 4
MFYFIVNKLLSSITDESKTIKVIIIASICYIILHAYLFSHMNENNEMIQKFKNYIYYMFLIDASLTGLYIWMYDNTDTDTDTDNEKHNNITTDKSEIKKSNLSDIHKKLLELKAKQNLKNQENNNMEKSAIDKLREYNKNDNNISPFATKNSQSTKLKHDNNYKEDDKDNENENENEEEENEEDENDENNEIEYELNNKENTDISIPTYKNTKIVLSEDTDIPLYN